MAETAAGLSPDEVRSLWTRFDALLTNGPSDDDLGPLNAFAELHQYRSRRKCAALPWTALLSALETP
jgi:nitrogen fixation NifU-like protein